MREQSINVPMADNGDSVDSYKDTTYDGLDQINMSTSPTTLRQLASLISNAVDEIEAMYAEQGLQFPSSDSPFDPTQASNTLLSHPKIVPYASQPQSSFLSRSGLPNSLLWKLPWL